MPPVAKTATLYMRGNIDRNVFIYEPVGDGTWRFSRSSPCHQGKNAFVIMYKSDADPAKAGWVLLDRSPTTIGSSNEIIGTPNTTSVQDLRGPPLGSWCVWGASYILVDYIPEHPGPPEPFVLEVPFATLRYSEHGAAARLDIKLNRTPIDDDVFEDVLKHMQRVLRNLAARPHMALFILSDAQDCSLPAFRHIKRYLSFVQENGTEFVLTGRGHAIVVKPHTLLGSTIIGIVRMIQRVSPPPWPETIVPTIENGEAFLAEFANKFMAVRPEDVAAQKGDPADSSSRWSDTSTPMSSPVCTPRTTVAILLSPCSAHSGGNASRNCGCGGDDGDDQTRAMQLHEIVSGLATKEGLPGLQGLPGNTRGPGAVIDVPNDFGGNRRGDGFFEGYFGFMCGSAGRCCVSEDTGSYNTCVASL
eukprot:TRINITY_DN69909_c0_g1_i1.p1 TRINITY_DN69909_c0_g1~~TRINITY_DN69909_c0_g1_i1.p1  ORF type:complete len:445 (+),score=50.42 TRINITY_DN69909_c0_g1_i1:85-1335(+)